MTKGLFLRFLAVAAAAVPTAALAQMGPGSELIGQPIQVTTNGVTNIVYLDPGGGLRILTPASNTVTGTWQVAGAIVPHLAGASDAPYVSPFKRVLHKVHHVVTTPNHMACAEHHNPVPRRESERGR